MADFNVPLIARGQVVDDYIVEFGDRGGAGRTFLTPDVAKYIDLVTLRDSSALGDLYSISLSDIYDYLEELGKRLTLRQNPHWKQAFEVSCHSSNLSRSVLEHIYSTAPQMYRRAHVSEVVEARIGSAYLEGWVPTKIGEGAEILVRAIGARSLHITAGNIPIVPLITMMRSAITRNDTIVKQPSNDPLTMAALALTMIEMAPDHPLTKHMTVCYWKGGNTEIEERICNPLCIDKIVAWGGHASIKHVSRYIRPGIDLITLDPKNSTMMLGKEVFDDEAVMEKIAVRAATDIASWDQEACSNARVIFLESGTDAKGIERANKFGERVFKAIANLPRTTTNGPLRFDSQLLSEIKSILSMGDFYKVFTDRNAIPKSGAVIVSQTSDPVDFTGLLYGRVANIVPVDDIESALSYFSAATQTVSVFPDELRRRIRDVAALAGGQRFIPVGYSTTGSIVAPQDGIEPERRMCRWVVDSVIDSDINPGPWVEPKMTEGHAGAVAPAAPICVAL